jgi:hypothetical protein
MIHETRYKSSDNMLAETLCEERKTGQQANHDLKRIQHAGKFLTYWLPSDSVEHANLVTVVTEPGFSELKEN